MLINKKSLQTLQTLKIKHDLVEFPLESNFLFIQNYKCIFISRYKNKLYHILASPACKFAFIDSQSYFNVIYSTDNLTEAIFKFHELVREVINNQEI